MASGPEEALAKAASVLQAMSSTKDAGNLHFIRMSLSISIVVSKADN
jgi:hypothetical protein